ncbi:MAG TPA: glycosyltransferase, partial [Negativicutes bacterium]|nr:glycosyltransferase [Negativicutes bacterium]
PVPTGVDFPERLHRTGTLANVAAAAGHQVTWWTAAFDRVSRQNLFAADTTLQLRPGLEIRLLHTPGYCSSISLARIRDQRLLADKFARYARQQPPPDVILCALPVIELCEASVRYGIEAGVPVVLDMRDMWPDIIVDTFPALLRPFARLLLIPMFSAARFACSQATAITGINDVFVDWGLARGSRAKTGFDRSFPLGYTVAPPPAEKIAAAEAFWDEHGVLADDPVFNICFFGTLGHQFDMGTIFAAADKLRDAAQAVRFIVCGSGDKIDQYRAMAADNPRVLLPGWADYAQMYVLMRRSRAGIDPLTDRYDFLNTVNNKAVEYLSAGLPVISSPRRGMLFDLLTSEYCGLSYDYGDADGLAAIIRSLVSGAGTLGTMSGNARTLFENKFRADRVYAGMTAYLEEIVQTYTKSQR